MSEAERSVDAPATVVGAPTMDGAPEDHGWALWVGGACSITRCIDQPVAAVQRAARGRRPSYWQPYCESHARARGVECGDGGLAWTAEFLEPTWRARRDPTP
jgi:hypothetical protein